MTSLELVEKRVFTGEADGFRAFFNALDSFESEPNLDSAKASRLICALTTLVVQRPLTQADFERLIGHGEQLRQLFARSGFAGPTYLVELLASPCADGNIKIDTADQLEKLLSLASIECTPAPVLGLIPKLRPQATLQVALHLLSDPALQRAPSLSAFVLQTTRLFPQLEVSDALLPAFGPAFEAADRFDAGGDIRTAIQAALAGWRNTKDWASAESSPTEGFRADGPPVVVSAEAVPADRQGCVFVGPFASVPGYTRTVRLRPRAAEAGTMLKKLSALRPSSVEFLGRRTPWWLLLLCQLRWAPRQSSRHVDLQVEATPFEPRPSAENIEGE